MSSLTDRIAIHEAASKLARSSAGQNALRALDALYSGGSLDLQNSDHLNFLIRMEIAGYSGTVRDAIRENLKPEDAK